MCGKQEQATAKTMLQKKLRLPKVLSLFQDSPEYKCSLELKGTYFPTLTGLAGDLRIQIRLLQTQMREFSDLILKLVNDGAQSPMAVGRISEKPESLNRTSSSGTKTGSLASIALSTQVLHIEPFSAWTSFSFRVNLSL